MPVVASILFGLVCAFLLSYASFEPLQVTPFSESTLGFAGSFENALYFVVLAAVGATLLYLLLKRNRHRLITVIIGIALTAAVLMLAIIYLSAALSAVSLPYGDVLILALSIFVTVVADYVVLKGRRFSSIVILGIGGALGTFLGFSLPTASTILILTVLAVYDAYAVYRGPVGKIAQNGIDQLRGLSYSSRDVQIGLGDLTFYSMLSGHMLLTFGLVPCLSSIAGILVGCLASLRMAEKKGVFPGLPLPIFLGLGTGFLALFLSSL